MQFADQFIQIATYLPSPNLFGFGDHVHKKLKVRNPLGEVWRARIRKISAAPRAFWRAPTVILQIFKFTNFNRYRATLKV